MKKLVSLLLLLALITCAASSLAEDYTVEGLYTVCIPEGMAVDNRSYAEETDWLFLAENDAMIIDAFRDTIPYYGDMTLKNPSEETVSDYRAFFEEDYEDSSPHFEERFAAPDGTVFFLYTLKDSEGRYLNAETVSCGYGISFQAYYFDGRDPDETLRMKLEEVLASFRPF